ncbi:glucosaminidase domain-containing protein [Gilvimarinus xylanilyticus]|uniref:Glucosaminidase domain-containing protein n=1 Tax=Gilvimarinus xylanilyticus TaxID=2944139 RepID=A0A9X2I7A3_9GAMM|nr:glucosaminidase domain-containing protein [Gilvimarinus xylanilyticus]MCP8900757.1 glucosaminidase domain-containing protein [Gilvimarinus xylanilyticus]
MNPNKKFIAVALALLIYAVGTLVLTLTLSLQSYRPAGLGQLSGSTRLPDLRKIENTAQRKQAFVNQLAPLIEQKNQALIQLRQELNQARSQLANEQPLTHVQQKRIERLSRRYKVDAKPPITTTDIDTLLRRLDALPPSMVLAQAAKESGWGTSRFARQGNNLFGQWCYTQGCGLVPKNRNSGARHEVQKFSGIEDAINAYYRNINTHQTYRDVRARRAQARKKNTDLSGLDLINGLNGYSSRGAVYVQELAQLIRYNDFEKLDASE